ncbi:MAG TPA: hypothetical protein VGM14_29715 [Streptosporangiaceae bacterium]
MVTSSRFLFKQDDAAVPPGHGSRAGSPAGAAAGDDDVGLAHRSAASGLPSNGLRSSDGTGKPLRSM